MPTAQQVKRAMRAVSRKTPHDEARRNAAVRQEWRDRARLSRAWTRILPTGVPDAVRGVVVHHHYETLVAAVLRGIPKRQQARRLKGSLAKAMKAAVDKLTRTARQRGR